MIYKTDVSKKEEIEGVVKELEEKLPGISGGKEAVLDIVFANAGIGKGWFLGSPKRE